MAITYGYFASYNGDRKYYAETISAYFAGILAPGVLRGYLGEMAATPGGGLNINLSSGKGYFSDGRWIKSDASIRYTADPADITYTRIDSIIMRKDASEETRACSILMRSGTPAAVPSPPALINSGAIEEIELWRVTVPAGTSELSASNFTDMRSWCEGLTEMAEIRGMIEEVLKAIGEENERTYVATGVDDNKKLSQMIQTWRAASSAAGQLRINIVGDNFAFGAPMSGAGNVSSRWKYIDAGSTNANTRKVILDFAGCDHVTIPAVLAYSIIMFGRNLKVKNLGMTIQSGETVSFTESQGMELENCNISLAGSGDIKFARGSVTAINCKVSVDSTNGNAYCFDGTGSTSAGLQRVLGGTYLAYTGDNSKVSAVAYTASGQANAILLMTNTNCPLVEVSQRWQTATVKLNSGKYVLVGNVLGRAISVYSTTDSTETGTIIASVTT